VPKKAHHEEHENLEAWVIPWADLLTLLLAMFLALYAVSNTDLQKLRALATAFRAEVKGGSSNVIDTGVKSGGQTTSAIDVGGAGILQGTGLSFAQQQLLQAVSNATQTAGDKAIKQLQQQAAAKAADQAQLDATRKQIESALNGNGLQGKFKFTQDARGLHITVLTDGVLFGSGQSNLSSAANQLLDGLGGALKDISNKIEVVGHTDSVGSERSNQALSTERAISVAGYLVDRFGISYSRIATSGHGASEPIADNATTDGQAKNRRVEITILSKALTDPAPAPTGDTATTDPLSTVATIAGPVSANAGGVTNG
jgi:chemotaxis protein MotB